MAKNFVSHLLQALRSNYWSASARGRDIQIRRATQPGSWLYLGFLLITALRTDYPSAHPLTFYFFSALIVLKSVARMLLVYTPRAFYSSVRFWNAAVYFLVLTTALAWGMFLATTLYIYGVSSETSVLILTCTVGSITGAITAVSPSLLLLSAYLLVLIIPTIVVESLFGGHIGHTLAGFISLLLGFLLWQGVILNMAHRKRVLTARIITQRRRELAARVHERTSELNAAKEAAESATRVKSEFLANMSHEIRTPMHGVLGMTQLAMDHEGNPAETNSCLRDVETSAKSLLQIIDDILDISRLEAGKLRIEIKPFFLRDCIESSLDVLRLNAAEKSLALHVTIDPLLSEKMSGDPLRLQQVVTNLVHNSIKFTNSGSISVEASLDHQAGIPFVHLIIEDTGCGIPLEQRLSVFEPFEQADSSTTRKFGGTGLGLAICSQLTQLMGGQIWIEGNVSGGSTIHVVLPRNLNASESARSASA